MEKRRYRNRCRRPHVDDGFAVSDHNSEPTQEIRPEETQKMWESWPEVKTADIVISTTVRFDH